MVNLSLLISNDELTENPRTEWDHLGTLVCIPRFDFGEQTLESDTQYNDLMNDDSLIKLPVYVYQHAGITVNTTGFDCPWDSGIIGLIYVSRVKAASEWGEHYTDDQVLALLASEIKTLAMWLSGDVWTYSIIDEDSAIEIDSCGGLYGYEYAEEMGNEALKYHMGE